MISRRAIVHLDDENKDPERIPTLGPFLFNLFYYLICSNDEAKVFEKRFDLTWGKIFLDGYKKSTISTYTRAAVLTCDVLYHYNENNVYLLHVLFSDLIANTKPTKLMNLVNQHRRCASSINFDEDRSKVSTNIKRLKSKGTILGLKPKIFTAIQMDNLEQYAKHHRNPSKALTSCLVIRAQQPKPHDSTMALVNSTDLHQSFDDSILPELDMSVNAPSEAMLNQDTFNETFGKTRPSSQASQDLSESSAKNVEEIVDINVASQASQDSSESSDKNFERPYCIISK